MIDKNDEMKSQDGSTTFCSFLTTSVGKCGMWTPDGTNRCERHKWDLKYKRKKIM